jgi:hypothetical protein
MVLVYCIICGIIYHIRHLTVVSLGRPVEVEHREALLFNVVSRATSLSIFALLHSFVPVHTRAYCVLYENCVYSVGGALCEHIPVVRACV